MTIIKFLRDFFYTPLENDSAFQSIVVRIIAFALAGLVVIALLVGLAQNNPTATIVLSLSIVATGGAPEQRRGHARCHHGAGDADGQLLVEQRELLAPDLRS